MNKRILKKQLGRIKIEIQELLGLLSIHELMTNWRFLQKYKLLHKEFIRV